MPAIIIPRRHLIQPQGRVTIAPEFATFVAGAVVGDQYFDGAQWGTVATKTGQEVAASPHGLGIRTSADVAPFGFALNAAVAPNECTIVFRGTPDDILQGANSAFSWANSDVTFVHMNGSLIDKGVAAYGTGISYFFNDTPSPDRIPLFGAYVGSYSNAAGGRIYVDGAVKTEGSHSPSQAVTLNSMWVGSRPNAANRCWRGISEMVALLRGANHSVSAELSINPYQIFRADPIRFYSLPSGAITLNSLTASNITSSGARFTVSVTR